MTTTSHNPSHEILYRSEDAQQILNIAIARQAEAGELTRTQLLEVAADACPEMSIVVGMQIKVVLLSSSSPCM